MRFITGMLLSFMIHPAVLPSGYRSKQFFPFLNAPQARLVFPSDDNTYHSSTLTTCCKQGTSIPIPRGDLKYLPIKREAWSYRRTCSPSVAPHETTATYLRSA